jgi:hypothetical protein
MASLPKCSEKVGRETWLKVKAEQATRRQHLLSRLQEKMAADPNGIWAELYDVMANQRQK